MKKLLMLSAVLAIACVFAYCTFAEEAAPAGAEGKDGSESCASGECGTGECPTVQSCPEAAAYLKTLEAFNGTWAGDGEVIGMGKFTDKTTYRPLFNGNLYEMTYEATCCEQNKVVWQETAIMGWDADNKRPFMQIFGMDGSFGYTTSCTVEGNKTICNGHTSGFSPMKEWRTTIEVVDADTYTFTMDVMQGEQWTPMLKSVAKRVK